MFGSTFVEAGIGLSMIFLLMSLMCSVLCEMYARWSGRRARFLFKAIDGLVSTPGLGKLVNKHPLIQGLNSKDILRRRHRPSYVPSLLFAQVVLDLLKEREETLAVIAAAPAPYTVATAVSAQVPPTLTGAGAEANQGFVVTPLSTPKVAVELSPAEKADAEAEAAEKANAEAALTELSVAIQVFKPAGALLADVVVAVAGWFDTAMERLSGHYKRSTQTTVFLLAVGLTLGLNVDTLVVGNRLQRDKSLRDAVVASAASFANEHKGLGALAPPGATVNDPAAATTTADAQNKLLGLEQQLEKLNLPIGWPTDAELTIADDKVAAADEALTRAREYARVPAALAASARDDLKTKGDAVVSSPPNTAAQEKTDRVTAYSAARAVAVSAGADDEKARSGVAEALLLSEHLKLDRSELGARMPTLQRPSAWNGASFRLFFLHLTGWLLTAIAVSLGTRFWFDTLSKLMSIRSGVKPEEKKATT